MGCTPAALLAAVIALLGGCVGAQQPAGDSISTIAGGHRTPSPT